MHMHMHIHVHIYTCLYPRMYEWMDGWMDGCLLQHTYCIRQNIILHTSVLNWTLLGFVAQLWVYGSPNRAFFRSWWARLG